MNDYQILHNAPEGATHFDGKTYFRFEMYEHGQAYLVLKNGVWDRGLPAYPVYSCRCLSDIAKLIKWYQGMDNLRDQLVDDNFPVSLSDFSGNCDEYTPLKEEE